MKTLVNESHSYSTVKIGLHNLSVRERALRMMKGLAAPKDATTDENVEMVYNLVMCDNR